MLNLADRVDRRRRIAAELARSGLAEGPVRIHTGRRFSDAGPFPSAGARGSFVSHLNALACAREDGVERLLLLEDDVQFTPGADRALGELAMWLTRETWHAVHIGYRTVLVDPDAGDGIRVRRFQRTLVGSQAVALHRSAIVALVEHMEIVANRVRDHYDGGPMHYDGAQNDLFHRRPDLLRFVVCPSLATQRPSRSDVRADPPWFDRFGLTRGAAQLARDLRRRL